MYLFKNSKKYNIVHDNLNGIWLITDLSNKKYKFYYRYKLSNGITQKSKKTKLSIETFINVSISTVLLLLLLVTLNSSTHDIANDIIYQKYYIDYPILNTSRSNINISDVFQIATEEINNKEYDNALKNLQIIINDNDAENDVTAHFYSGVILQKEGKYNDAIAEYEKVIIDNDNLFIDQSNWYIGLWYLKLNKKDKAIEYFNKITTFTYKEKVKEILSEIN